MSGYDNKDEPVRTRVFKLEEGGASYQAAMAIHAMVKDAVDANPFGKTGYTFQEEHDYWSSLYGDIYARLKADNPDLLKEAGLLAPATQITTYEEGHSRSYQHFPVIYMDEVQTQEYDFLPPEKHTELYLYAPVDYKGNYFIPTDAKLLDEDEEKEVGNNLFAGGWLTPASVMHIERSGVAVPQDFDPACDNVFRNIGFGDQEDVVFLAEGRSLDLIEDFQRSKDNWQAACNAYMSEVKRILQNELRQEVSANLPAGESYNINASYSRFQGGKPDFTISVRQQGNIDIMAAGQPVSIPPNPYFSFRKEPGGEYIIRPSDAPEGKVLKDLLQAIPSTPSLKDYPELKANFTVSNKRAFAAIVGSDNSKIPQIQEFSGKVFLRYTADKGQAHSFCPPGATPVTSALFRWLQEDQGDLNWGITPPPMPKMLDKELSRLFAKPRKNDDGGKFNLEGPA